MKATIKFLIIAAASLAGLSACNQDNERAFYDESAPAAYSFLQSNIVSELTPDHNGTLQVGVTRTNASEPATVQVQLTAASTATTDLFTLASTAVSFEAGAYEATANVQFTLDDLATDGSQYQFALEFTDPATPVSVGGNTKTNVKASRKLTWERYATGTFTDVNGFGQQILKTAANWTVTMYKTREADIYRLADFYTKAGSNYDFTWDGGVAIQPSGIAVTLGSAPTFGQVTGFTYNYNNADNPVYLFTDPDPDYTYYDPDTKTFTINAYAGMLIGTSVSGWGWVDHTYQITETY